MRHKNKILVHCFYLFAGSLAELSSVFFGGAGISYNNTMAHIYGQKTLQSKKLQTTNTTTLKANNNHHSHKTKYCGFFWAY